IDAADGAAAEGDYAIRMDAPHAAAADERRLQDARSLRARAHDSERAGRYPEARALFEEALTITESVRGSADSSVAILVFELAGNALTRLDNTQARALYERARAVFERDGGLANPFAAMARSRLALLDERAGQRQKAEAGIREALPVLERALG